MADTPAVAAFAIPDPSTRTATLSALPLRRAMRALSADRAARAALVFFALLAGMALLAPLVAPHDPLRPLDAVALRGAPPSLAHWFGTDLLSRDVFSRVVYGARVSLSVSVLAALLAAVVGTCYGGVAGFVGGRMDAAMMRGVDALLAIPRVLLLLTVVSLWSAVDLPALILLLGLTGWLAVARLARSEAAALRTREFVVAARALGTSPARIFVRHVLPHLAGPVLVAATIAMGQVVVLEAGLSFLGVGVAEPTPTWGNIIRDGRETIASTWWLTLFPGLTLVGTALATNTLADRLRSAMNPRQLPAP
jgi:peptide/nickel transport system permease protein